MKRHLYTYRVLDVTRVIDGDTIEVVIDLGFNLSKKLRVRLMDYDAPELYHPVNESEKNAAQICKSKLQELLDKYKDRLYLQTFKDPGIYGRYSGRLFYDSNESTICINEVMKSFIEQNHLDKPELRGETK